MWIFNGVIKMMTYPNRIAARKEFKKLAIWTRKNISL
jgi:hypothetical protein